jgi:hypothetical protein
MARATAPTRSGTVIATVVQCLAALLVIYALTLGIGSLIAVALAAAGVARAEAAALASMLAYVIYLIVLLWAVHWRGTLRLWVLLGGGAILANAMARWGAAGLGVLG